LSQGVVGQAFPEHLKSKASQTMEGKALIIRTWGWAWANLIYMNDVKWPVS